jgi:hypothetical protein
MFKVDPSRDSFPLGDGFTEDGGDDSTYAMVWVEGMLD